MPGVTIWSDLTCPWAYVACVRLHRMRNHLGADVVDLEFRALPTELLSEGGQARSQPEAVAEIVALAQREHTMFSHFDGRWPRSTVVAWEAQKWAYGLSQETGEQFDLALRRAVFLHSHDISEIDEIAKVAHNEGLDGPALMAALEAHTHRDAVMADVAEAERLDITDPPVIVLPDGTMHSNPGVTVEWSRGIPLILEDHPSVYEDIIMAGATED